MPAARHMQIHWSTRWDPWICIPDWIRHAKTSGFIFYAARHHDQVISMVKKRICTHLQKAPHNDALNALISSRMISVCCLLQIQWNPCFTFLPTWNRKPVFLHHVRPFVTLYLVPPPHMRDLLYNAKDKDWERCRSTWIICLPVDGVHGTWHWCTARSSVVHHGE